MTFDIHQPVTLGWAVFNFVLLSLAAFRLTRLFTTDVWPPIAKLREFLIRKAGDSPWAELYTCPWCFGLYATTPCFLALWYFRSIPLPLAQFAAVLALVGYLGTYDERD